MMKHLQFALSLSVVVVAAFSAIYLVEGYLEGRSISEAAIPGMAPARKPQDSLLSKLTHSWNPQKHPVTEPLQAKQGPVAEEPAQVHHGLCVAAMTGNKEQTENLLDTGVSANAKDSFGIRAVARATLWGHQDVVRLLLERGARVNERERLGVTLLMLAANQGDEKLLSLFLEYGADVNARSEDGETALLAARKKGFGRIAELLIQAGAEESLLAAASLKKAPKNPEHPAEASRLSPLPVQEPPGQEVGSTPVIESVLSETLEQEPRKGSVDAQSLNQEEPMMPGETPDASSAADALVWAADISGESIRMLEEEMVREIQSRDVPEPPAPVSEEVRISARQEKKAIVPKKMPLPSAEERNKDLEELAAMIEEIKALSFVNANEGAAVQTAAEPAPKKKVPAAVQPDKAQTVKAKVPAAAPVANMDPLVEDKPIPVVPAAAVHEPEPAQLPVEKVEVLPVRELPKARPVLIAPRAAPPAARSKVPTMELFHAVVTGNSQKVKFCLDRGVDVNVRGALGMTPLMVASQEGNLGIVQMLLQKQADVGARNVVGQTALRLAALKERHDIMVMLQRHGARE